MDTSSISSGVALDEPIVNRRRWWIHLLLIVGYLLLVGVMGMEHKKSGVPALAHTGRDLLITCTTEMMLFAVVFGVAVAISRASRNDLLLRWRPGFWVLPLGVGYSIALRLMLGFMILVVGVILIATHIMTPESLRIFFMTNRPDVESVVDISAMRQNPLYFWLVLTLVSFIVAGLREELWRSAFLTALRKLWPQYFGSRGGQVVAVAVVAVVFGLGHLRMGLLAVLMAGLLGFGLGIIMVLHRSVWPAVIAHGLFDATSFGLLPWATEKLQEFQRTLGH